MKLSNLYLESIESYDSKLRRLERAQGDLGSLQQLIHARNKLTDLNNFTILVNLKEQNPKLAREIWPRYITADSDWKVETEDIRIRDFDASWAARGRGRQWVLKMGEFNYPDGGGQGQPHLPRGGANFVTTVNTGDYETFPQYEFSGAGQVGAETLEDALANHDKAVERMQKRVKEIEARKAQKLVQ